MNLDKKSLLICMALFLVATAFVSAEKDEEPAGEEADNGEDDKEHPEDDKEAPQPEPARQPGPSGPQHHDNHQKHAKVFSYAGKMIPKEWMLVSILNDRVVIGFNNGTSRNLAMDELDEKNRDMLRKLHGTMTAFPIDETRDKFAVWGNKIADSATKFGSAMRSKFDTFMTQHGISKGSNNGAEAGFKGAGIGVEVKTNRGAAGNKAGAAEQSKPSEEE